jgi:hypothetical protein
VLCQPLSAGRCSHRAMLPLDLLLESSYVSEGWCLLGGACCLHRLGTCTNSRIRPPVHQIPRGATWPSVTNATACKQRATTGFHPAVHLLPSSAYFSLTVKYSEGRLLGLLPPSIANSRRRSSWCESFLGCHKFVVRTTALRTTSSTVSRACKQ